MSSVDADENESVREEVATSVKSFRITKTSGDEDVTHEALLWLIVFVLVIAPLLWGVSGGHY